MAKKAEKKIKCAFCGETKPESEFYQHENNASQYCTLCEQGIYDKIAESVGYHLALYAMCLSTNTPFFPLILPQDLEEYVNIPQKWIHYNSLLDEKNYREKDGRMLTFFDGATNILQVFGRKLSQPDTARFVEAEIAKAASRPGTEEQRERWGEEDGYTTEDYNALDRMYHNRASNFKGQTITDQMRYTLEEVAKWSLLADKLRREKDTRGAMDALKAIDNLLASECLRKKDEKPVENFRPDAWIDAFEKSGLVKDGDFLPMKEMQDALLKVMRGKGYDQTLDAAYQLEMNIINNARRNEDKPVLYELPEDMEIKDGFGEFAKKESAEEKDAKKYAQLTKVRIAKKGRKPDADGV